MAKNYSSNDWLTAFDLELSGVESQKFVFPLNPLALILCLREYHTDEWNIIHIIDEFIYGKGASDRANQAIKHVNDKHMQKACDIVEHYVHKFAQLRLAGKRLTDFRKTALDICKKIINNQFVFAINEMKAMYRLVDFYEEDMFIDDLADNHKSYSLSGLQKDTHNTMRYVGSQRVVRRHMKKTMFYFRNTDNTLSVVAVPDGNNLIGLLDYFIKNDNAIVVNGEKRERVMDQDTGFSALEFVTLEVVAVT